jgi:diguanylate cyclase
MSATAPPDLPEPPGDAVAGARARSVAELSLVLADLAQAPALLHAAVVGRVAELVGDASVLWLRDAVGEITIAALSHPDEDVARRMRETIRGVRHDPEGFLGQVWQTESAVRLSPAELEVWLPLMSEPYREYFSAEGMAAMLLVPLRVRGDNIGLLGVTRGTGAAYSAGEATFLSQVSAVVAVAVDNARLLDDLRLELTARGLTEQAAQRSARLDVLTGLPNRRALAEALDKLRAGGRELALLVIDLDGFKHVNDTFGHPVGDELLVAVARRLEPAVAALAPEGTLARLGGDEFALVLPSVDGASAVAAGVVSAFAEPFVLPELSLPLSASVGLASALDGDPDDALLRLADIAMYRAKGERTGWAEHDPERDRRAGRRLREVAELRTALDGGQLELHYQPIVPAADPRALGGTRHVEALVRWRHPDNGLVPPGEFLPLAADAGLMPRLTEVVVDAALDQAAAWKAAGLDVQISVNVPAGLVADPVLRSRVLEGLRNRGLAASALAVELTESELVDGGGLDGLRALRAVGVDVSLDDFGTGYSSLAYLADVPATSLKIDRAFLGRLVSSPRHQGLVDAVVRCAHGLGLQVVAEGVEQDAESALLVELGVDLMQGFLFARPVPAAEVEPWLARQA